MKAFVDKDTCISCGLCPTICPEVFEMQEDGKAGIRDNGKEATFNNRASEEDIIISAKEAEESCPVDAISVN